MSIRPTFSMLLAIVVGLLGTVGCWSDRDLKTLEPLPANTDPIVFGDDFGDAVDFQAFLGSNLSSLSIDPTQSFSGSASLKFAIPVASDPNGGWAGGAFVTASARELTQYNALTFWAKSSVATTMDVGGLGNDNTGESLFTAERPNIPLTADWSKVTIPIPDPTLLTEERGMFFLAEGPESATGHDLWIDEVQFEFVDNFSDPRPAMTSQSLGAFVGAEVVLEGARTTYTIDGTNVVIGHSVGYFNLSSSDESVAVVKDGVVSVIGGGAAVITGKLGDIDVVGTISIDATAPPSEPAPTPGLAASDVISIYSDAYSDITVDTWSADWDVADYLDTSVDGDEIKAYTNLTFAGIEFGSNVIDASEMTHFHVDVWLPAGNIFSVKLVDFGANGTFDARPPADPADADSEHEIRFTGATTPPLVVGEWMSLDIPLSDFTGLRETSHLAQLILVAARGSTVYVDNIYFHK